MNASKWVAVWGSSPSITAPLPARYAKNITLRYTLRAMLTGSQIRLHFSNLFGYEDAAIARVFVAPILPDGRAGAPVPITFAQSVRCELPAGGEAVSDAVPFPLTRGQDYAVSFYLDQYTPLGAGTNCTGPLCRFAYAEGDYAAAPELPAVRSLPIATAFFLCGVDALCDEKAHALVCFGDSITAQSWPDYLTLRVLREGDEHLSVIRRGIGGSRVLRGYAHLAKRHYGADGHSRFEREVNAAGADRVIILHGVNDIIHPNGSEFQPWSDLPTADELIEGLRWYVDKGHAMGLRVYLSPITAIEGWSSYLPERETIRQAVNAWVRSQTLSDGVVDFDAATHCADRPNRLDPICDSGDHLHPSLQGAQRMAESIPEAFLR